MGKLRSERDIDIVLLGRCDNHLTESHAASQRGYEVYGYLRSALGRGQNIACLYEHIRLGIIEAGVFSTRHRVGSEEVHALLVQYRGAAVDYVPLYATDIYYYRTFLETVGVFLHELHCRNRIERNYGKISLA